MPTEVSLDATEDTRETFPSILPGELRNRIYELVLVQTDAVYISTYNPQKLDTSCVFLVRTYPAYHNRRFKLSFQNHRESRDGEVKVSWDDPRLKAHLQNHIRMPRTVPPVHAQFLRTNTQVWKEATSFLYENSFIINITSPSVLCMMCRLGERRNHLMFRNMVCPELVWSPTERENQVFWSILRIFLEDRGILKEVTFSNEFKFLLPGEPREKWRRCRLARLINYRAHTRHSYGPEHQRDQRDLGSVEEDIFFDELRQRIIHY
ncbi:MAG: hypothetical protein M1831_005813 [Alyxoria varia]|nr:MAG: hypothetical protein M1831_005813 [Alyxoria varia]